MDYLLDYMPIVGDLIRLGKDSYKLGEKLGEIIGGFFEQRNNSESDFAVVWRRTDVFIKEEKEKAMKGDYGSNIGFYLFFPPLMCFMAWGFICCLDENMIFFPIGLLGIAVSIIWFLFNIIIPYFQRNKIKETSEIEVTSDLFKIIRTNTGKKGICYWKDFIDFKLLLRPIYCEIEKGFDNSYIVKDGDKFFLYNTDLRMFVTEGYDFIVKYQKDIYLFVKGDEVSLMTSRGDRLYQ